jgi:hypothetical protein
VWNEVADVATPDARLVVRFGAIPSVRSDPVALIRHSIALTDGRWIIRAIHDAGHANHGKRQAVQFPVSSQPISEVDLVAERGTA